MLGQRNLCVRVCLCFIVVDDKKRFKDKNVYWKTSRSPKQSRSLNLIKTLPQDTNHVFFQFVQKQKKSISSKGDCLFDKSTLFVQWYFFGWNFLFLQANITFSTNDVSTFLYILYVCVLHSVGRTLVVHTNEKIKCDKIPKTNWQQFYFYLCAWWTHK